ncbi:hypothetical protein BD626DRAFT_483101 [Schizophyllum amplum]|uniref:HIT domain-containing protein n=1 Tax=Schizophyllum amplum TaxID=97359 RepID=A0A550CP48_9AGAR|nr:hypothetical protein BD626DRAFT_483101 [Auriculariopsis ampla]
MPMWIRDPEYFVYRDDKRIVSVCPFPSARGQVSITDADGERFSGLPEEELVQLFVDVRYFANMLAKVAHVRRVGMASDGRMLHLIPMHGLGDEWQPILHAKEVSYPTWPGYFTSKNGPRMKNEDLDATQAKILAAAGLQPPFDNTFHGDLNDTNLFARIVRGEEEQWRIWENETHVAFLTPFGNTVGYTVVVPRRHTSSDVFQLAEADYEGLIRAVHSVLVVLKKAFDTKTVGVFFEGFEIDYTHAKLIPAHGEGPEVKSDIERAELYDTYPGFLTTQAGPAANKKELVALRDALCQCNTPPWLD